MCPLLSVIGRVSGGYWRLTEWASEAHPRVSCPVRVGWVLHYDRDADLERCALPGIYTKVYPDWTCGTRCTLIGHVGPQPPTRGLDSWTRVLEATLQPMGFQPLTTDTRRNATPEGFEPWPRVLEATPHPMGLPPLTMDPRSNLTPEGFEPLTKSSRGNSPTNCTLWHHTTESYRLVWAKKVSLAAICLVAGSASFGLREN